MTAIGEITQVPSNATVIKIINALIKRYNSLANVYTFKGSVETYNDLLAIQNPTVGDVYNVKQEDTEHGVAAGSNFVWDGTVWDNLGMSLDGLVRKINGFAPNDLGAVIFQYIKTIEDDDGTLTVTIRNGESESKLVIETGKVKTVNGVEPDESGNIAIEAPQPTIATRAEAEAGTNNTKFMTPLRTKEAISVLAGTVKSVNGMQPDENGDVDITKFFPLWHNDYGNGNDGEFVPAADTTISGIKNYTRVNIPIGVTVTVDKFTHIKCNGNVEINGTLKAIGGAGGAVSKAGESGYFATGGTGGTGNVYSPGAGGGALETAEGVTGVTAVLAYLKTENTALTNIYSAGGGGGDWAEPHNGSPGVGGDGGGGVLIVCKNFAVSGNIDASGENGENGHSPYGTGGGGGGGGLVFVVCDDSNVTGTISINGGKGGARAWSGWAKGTGVEGADGVSFIKER